MAALSLPEISSLPSAGCSAGSVSPHAENLRPVQNAEAILAGELPPESLGVRAANDHHLVLTLEKPDSGITTVLAQWYAAPCKESFFTQQKGRYGLEMKTTLYNGPYVISLYESGKEIRLRQNANYHSDQPAVLYGANIALGCADPLAAFAEGDSFYAPVPRAVVGDAEKGGHHRVCRYHLCPGGEHRPQPAGERVHPPGALWGGGPGGHCRGAARGPEHHHRPGARNRQRAHPGLPGDSRFLCGIDPFR